MKSEDLVIRSRDNPLAQRVRRLARDNTAYRSEGEIWLEGDHLCRAYLAHGQRPRRVVCSSGFRARGLHAELLAAGPLSEFSDAVFASCSGVQAPTGLGFLVASPADSRARPGVDAVVLDRLQDAGNVGTILRSAAAFGVPQVLALEGTAALWSPKVLRAGMGAHFSLHLVEGLKLEDLAGLGLALLGTSSHAEHALHLTRLPRPHAWVLGQEGQGVSPQLSAACAMHLGIPQPGGEESLNVAAAAAVCLYEAARQRLLADDAEASGAAAARGADQ